MNPEDLLLAQLSHPAASPHQPSFITAPGETDVLMVVMGVVLLLFVLMVGNLYFRLHALPDRLGGKKVQYEIVCVLAILAMFTRMHIFWIAGLLLALVDIPDFGTSLNRIAGSAEKAAGLQPGEGAVELPSNTIEGTSGKPTKRLDHPALVMEPDKTTARRQR
ncbi:MAG: hypothetical protein WCD54_11965 [Pseudolabrys sp.]